MTLEHRLERLERRNRRMTTALLLMSVAAPEMEATFDKVPAYRILSFNFSGNEVIIFRKIDEHRNMTENIMGVNFKQDVLHWDPE